MSKRIEHMEELSCHETSSQKIYREFFAAVCDAHGRIRDGWTRDEVFTDVHRLVFDAQNELFRGHNEK